MAFTGGTKTLPGRVLVEVELPISPSSPEKTRPLETLAHNNTNVYKIKKQLYKALQSFKEVRKC